MDKRHLIEKCCDANDCIITKLSFKRHFGWTLNILCGAGDALFTGFSFDEIIEEINNIND